NDGVAKLTLLKRLKKSNENSNFTRSVMLVSFASRKSKFQNHGPRKASERPWRPSRLSSVRRNELNTLCGSANRFNPVPPAAGLPPVPTPPEPDTPELTPVLIEPGSTRGMAPLFSPESDPPKTPALSTTNRGRPENARQIPEAYQPPITLFSAPLPLLQRCPEPNGRS